MKKLLSFLLAALLPSLALAQSPGLQNPPTVGTITGLGSAVGAALAINVGAAGSIVVNGGALGTPSSGVATNLTGTAASLTAGHVTTNANLTGDVTSTGNATTFATVNTNVGSFGSATQSPTYTVNGKGLITAAANVTITPAVGSITGLGTGVGAALAINTGTAGAPVLFSGAIGAATGTTLALGGCSIGTNVLCGTGTANFSGTVTTGNSGGFIVASGFGIFNNSSTTVAFRTANNGADVSISAASGIFSGPVRGAAATIFNFSTDGVVLMTNSAGNAGFVLNGNTDGQHRLYARDGATPGVYASGTSVGISCSGTPTSSFASVNGIVTHC